uniref:Ladderlectin n=1 Tax=Oreochromis niloticus TaxID=8128 RepID=A0A669EJV2_ORENI
MKTVLLLSALLYAALAAPAEDNHEASEEAMVILKEDVAAAPAQEFEGADTPQSRFNFCPDGWFSYGSRCFKFINSPKSWISAEEYCNSLGGNLASVANPREYSFLQQMTQTAGRTTAWLGGFRLQMVGVTLSVLPAILSSALRMHLVVNIYAKHIWPVGGPHGIFFCLKT